MEIPKQFFALFSANKRARPVPTFIVALVVTALVAVPLTIRAVEASDEPEPVAAGADPNLVMVDTADSDPGPLDGATLAGPILVSLNHPTASGVSFNLFASGSNDPLIASQDLEGPQFDLLVNELGRVVPLDSTLLADGEYELFLTLAMRGGEQRTAVRFEIENP